mgnify:CR=1 FL=1
MAEAYWLMVGLLMEEYRRIYYDYELDKRGIEAIDVESSSLIEIALKWEGFDLQTMRVYPTLLLLSRSRWLGLSFPRMKFKSALRNTSARFLGMVRAFHPIREKALCIFGCNLQSIAVSKYQASPFVYRLYTPSLEVTTW